MARATAANTVNAKKKAAFLEDFAKTGCVTDSAKNVGISRTHIYTLREKDEDFAAGFEEAREKATDALEAEGRRRAVEGVEEPVFYQGKECGVVRKYSDTLLIFLLKGNNPKKFVDRLEHTSPDGSMSQRDVTVKIIGGEREEVNGKGKA